MKFFILAAGYGKRAEPLSRFKPKPAFPLGGVPLISLLLRQLRAQGCRQGFVNLHHLAAQVAAAAGGGAGLRYFEEKELSGSRVLQQALPYFSDWLLAVNGDTFLDIPLAELRRAAAADERADGVLLARRDDSGAYADLRLGPDGYLESTAARPAPARGGLMYAGAALFRKKAVAQIEETNFFASIASRRLRFRTVLYDGLWLDMGTPASYFRANWEFMARSACGRANALSPGVILSKRAQVERCVLWENTRVGPDVRLADCIVTGNLELRSASHRGQIVSARGTWPLF